MYSSKINELNGSKLIQDKGITNPASGYVAPCNTYLLLFWHGWRHDGLYDVGLTTSSGSAFLSKLFVTSFRNKAQSLDNGTMVVRYINSYWLLQHLERQQVGLLHLITIIKDDLQDLGTIERGLTELPSSRT